MNKLIASSVALALAAAGSLTAAGPAMAKARPYITIHTKGASHTAGSGTRTIFYGYLHHTGPRNNKTVFLQRRDAGKWHTRTRLFHQDDGKYTFPPRSIQAVGTYVFRTLVKRHGRLLDTSPTTKVIVKPKPKPPPPPRDDTANLQIRASDQDRAAGCFTTNIGWTTTALDTSSWSLTITARKPDGTQALTDTETGKGSLSGHVEKQLCGDSYPAGDYAVTGTLTSAQFDTMTEDNMFTVTDAPAGKELLPDLQMRNLNTCSATEQSEAQVAGGTGCFSIQTDGTGPEAGKRLLKFPATTFNVGDGPMEVNSTRTDGETEGTASWHATSTTQRVYSSDGTTNDIPSPAQFYWESEPNGATDSHGHQHWHVVGFDDYSITGQPGTTDDKHGFCLQDNTSAPGTTSNAAYPNDTSCGYKQPNANTIQHGLSTGWGDTYPSSLPDQGIDIGSLPDGTYTVRVTADAQNLVKEKDETNNSVSARVTIQGDKVTTVTATGGI